MSNISIGHVHLEGVISFIAGYVMTTSKSLGFSAMCRVIQKLPRGPPLPSGTTTPTDGLLQQVRLSVRVWPAVPSCLNDHREHSGPDWTHCVGGGE